MTGQRRAPAYPAASVLVVPGALFSGYTVQVCYVAGLARRRITVAVPDMAGVAEVLGHAFEGRHNLGDASATCPLCGVTS